MSAPTTSESGAPGVSAPRASVARLVRHSLVYSMVPVLQRAIGFLLIPLFTWKLNPAQWGVQQLTDLLVVAATQAAGINLLAAMVRFYFDGRTERDRNATVSTAVIVLGLASWVLVGIALVFRAPLAAALFEAGDPNLRNTDIERCLVIALCTIPFALSSEAGFRYLQVLERSGTYTLLRTLKFAVELGLKIWMVVGLDWGVTGFLLSVLVGEVLTATLLTGGILLRIAPRVEWARLQPMLVYAAPLVPVGLLQMGLHQLDRVMLKALGPAELAMTWVGIYGLGYQIGFMVQQVGMGSFMQAFQPAIFAVSDPLERRRIQARVGTYALLFVGAASSVLILFSSEAIHLLAGQEGYWGAERVLPWVTCAYLFYGIYALGQVTLLAEKRTVPLLWINVAALAVNLGLDWVMIPPLGYVGPAIAKLLAFVLQAALIMQIAHRRHDAAQPEWRRIAAIFGLVLAATAIGVVFVESAAASGLGLLWQVELKLAVLLAILVVMRYGVLHRDERAELQRRLRGLPVVGRLFAAP